MSDVRENSDFPTITAEPLSAAEVAAARSEYRMLKRLLIVALWVSCALALSLNLADPDLWGHVRYGQDVLRDGQLHRTATHTYTAVDSPWVNHENIAELTYAAIYAWFDDEGLLIFKTLVGLAILVAMGWVGHRNGVKLLTMSAFLLLIANNLTAFFPVRPQVLSFAWCTLMLLVFEKAFTGWHLWIRNHAPAMEQPPEGTCAGHHANLPGYCCWRRSWCCGPIRMEHSSLAHASRALTCWVERWKVCTFADATLFPWRSRAAGLGQ